MPPLDRRQLENDPAVVYILDRRLQICYCNRAWDRFATANGGHGLEREGQTGRAVMSVVPAPLQSLYSEAFTRVLSTGQPWSHSYECSSPTLFRSYRMLVYRSPDAEEVVVVNSLSVERPHRTGAALDAAAYRDSYGVIGMCCECRRTIRPDGSGVWDWVPSFVERLPELVSHGICDVCVKLIYPSYSAD